MSQKYKSVISNWLQKNEYYITCHDILFFGEGLSCNLMDLQMIIKKTQAMIRVYININHRLEGV